MSPHATELLKTTFGYDSFRLNQETLRGLEKASPFATRLNEHFKTGITLTSWRRVLVPMVQLEPCSRGEYPHYVYSYWCGSFDAAGSKIKLGLYGSGEKNILEGSAAITKDLLANKSDLVLLWLKAAGFQDPARALRWVQKQERSDHMLGEEERYFDNRSKILKWEGTGKPSETEPSSQVVTLTVEYGDVNGQPLVE
jgi:hypothetical protein